MKQIVVFVIAAAALTLASSEPRAQDIDADLLLKWGQAPKIHYDLVAEFSGDVMILKGGSVWGGETQAKDRFELSFDWTPVEMKLLSKPVFKNFPSTVPANIFEKECAQPPITGAYDHVEITEVKPFVLGLELTAKRTYPAGSIPYLNEERKCGLIPSPAKSEAVKIEIIPPLGTHFAYPSMAPKNYTVGKDGKTMIVQEKGWKYTYTMRIVE